MSAGTRPGALRGGLATARVVDCGERIQGNWGGALSAAVNVVTSVALILLFATGLVLWGRRRFRPRQRDRGSRSAPRPQRTLTPSSG